MLAGGNSAHSSTQSSSYCGIHPHDRLVSRSTSSGRASESFRHSASPPGRTSDLSAWSFLCLHLSFCRATLRIHLQISTLAFPRCPASTEEEVGGEAPITTALPLVQPPPTAQTASWVRHLCLQPSGSFSGFEVRPRLKSSGLWLSRPTFILSPTSDRKQSVFLWLQLKLSSASVGFVQHLKD